MPIRWRWPWRDGNVYRDCEVNTLLEIRKRFVAHVLDGKEEFSLIPRWFCFITSGSEESTKDTKVPLSTTSTRDYSVASLPTMFGKGKLATKLQNIASIIKDFQQRRTTRWNVLERGYPNDPVHMVCCSLIDDFLVKFSEKSTFNDDDLELFQRWCDFIESINDVTLFPPEDSELTITTILSSLHNSLTVSDKKKKILCPKAEIEHDLESRSTGRLLEELDNAENTIIQQAEEFLATVLSKKQVPSTLNRMNIAQATLHSNTAYNDINKFLSDTNIGLWVNVLHHSVTKISSPKRKPAITGSDTLAIEDVSDESPPSSPPNLDNYAECVARSVQDSEDTYQFKLLAGSWKCGWQPNSYTPADLVLKQFWDNHILIDNYMKVFALIEKLSKYRARSKDAVELSGKVGDLMNLSTGRAVNQFAMDTTDLTEELRNVLHAVIDSVRGVKNSIRGSGKGNIIPQDWDKNFERAIKIFSKIDAALTVVLRAAAKLLENAEKIQRNPELLLNDAIRASNDFSKGISFAHNDLRAIGIGRDLENTAALEAAAGYRALMCPDLTRRIAGYGQNRIPLNEENPAAIAQPTIAQNTPRVMVEEVVEDTDTVEARIPAEPPASPPANTRISSAQRAQKRYLI